MQVQTGQHWAVPVLLCCGGRSKVLQSVDTADGLTPLGWCLLHGSQDLALQLWKTAR